VWILTPPTFHTSSLPVNLKDLGMVKTLSANSTKTLPTDVFAKVDHSGASNDAAKVDSESSDINVPHDVTCTNALAQVHENDGKEMNNDKTVSSHALTCAKHIPPIPGMYTCTTTIYGARFEVKEGPKLEEWIPEQYLPEVLVVYDPDRVLLGPESVKIYKRTHPPPASTGESKEGNAVHDG
jgi:hypothetical protein